MMMTKQKFITLLLVLTVSIVGLTACGNNQNATSNGIEIVEAIFTAPTSGLAQTPYNTDIVFAVNNVIDGSVQLQNAVGIVGSFSLKFNLTTPYSGEIKFTVVGADNKEFSRTANADFAETGENSFVALVNFGTVVSGSYTINLYFGDNLVYSDQLSATE